MVDAGLGNFAHGQPEMTSQWCHVAVVHAGMKVRARYTGVRAGGPGWRRHRTCFYQGMSVS